MTNVAIFLALFVLALVGCAGKMLQSEPETNTDYISSNQVNSNQSIPAQAGIDTGSTYTAKGIETKVGIVSTIKDDQVCVRALNAQLKPGEEIYLITPYERPHEIARMRIVRKMAETCVDDASDIGDGEEIINKTSYYLAEVFEKASEYQTLSGFAFLDSSISPALENGIVTAELTGKPPKEYFRECTSFEGMHFTVWTGRPLVGKRIWHRYYYLRYDTEPTCKKKDYEY